MSLTLCSEKVEQQSKRFDYDSCATKKIHSNDSTSSTSTQSGENDSTTFDFKLSRLPQGTQEEIVALCYATQILDVIRNLKIYDCPGCVITALSQQDHTCLTRGYRIVRFVPHGRLFGFSKIGKNKELK